MFTQGEQQQQASPLKALRGTVYAGALIADGYPAADVHGEFPYYCPGCGRCYRYPGTCNGKAESPHQVIETVPTDELSGDNHTPAPNTDKLG